MFKTIKITCISSVFSLLTVYVFKPDLRVDDMIVFSMVLSLVAFCLEIADVYLDKSEFI